MIFTRFLNDAALANNQKKITTESAICALSTYNVPVLYYNSFESGYSGENIQSDKQTVQLLFHINNKRAEHCF